MLTLCRFKIASDDWESWGYNTAVDADEAMENHVEETISRQSRQSTLAQDSAEH